MPIVEYSDKDFLRDKLVTPAWYRMLIETVGEWVPAKDQSKGPSNNMVLDGVIQFNADNGSKEFEGVPVGGPGAWSFNSKAMGFSLGLSKSLAPQLGIKEEDITPKTKIEFKHFEGKVVDVFVTNSTYLGRTRNKVEHQYRTPKFDQEPGQAQE